MSEAVRQVAIRHLDGTTLTEGLLNHIEIAIRCFDPCPSCATHAPGKMPLKVDVADAGGTAIDGIRRDSAACDGIRAPRRLALRHSIDIRRQRTIIAMA